jgi:acetoin utilization deacetylase AcuC-like enzyme
VWSADLESDSHCILHVFIRIPNYSQAARRPTGMLMLLAPTAGAFLPFRLPGTKQNVALYTSEVCVQHDPGPQHPESPARLQRLRQAMQEEWLPEFGEHILVCEPAVDVTREQLRRVHTQKHVNRVQGAFSQAQVTGLVGARVPLDADTLVSGGTGAAASRAAGLVIAAVDDVLGGKLKEAPLPGGRKLFDDRSARKVKQGVGSMVALPAADARPRRAFVMARPPGHHAEAESAQGFCFYNNVMVGVAHAQRVYGLERVAILDFDVHHGNGDSDIALADPGWLYVSSHETPSFPYTGETAGRTGEHKNVVNWPLPKNAGSAEFRRAWRDQLLPAVRSFRPQAIFLSSGFDAHANDPLSSTQLSDDDYEWLTAEVANIGGGNLPIISVLEGGYNVEQLVKSVRVHLKTLVSA